MKTIFKSLNPYARVLLILLTTSAAFAAQALQPLRGDGELRLFNYHLNEWLEVKFRDGEKIIPEAMVKLQRLLRSREQSQSSHALEAELFDLLDHLQDHFGADTVEIISGYRSPELNGKLLKTGHKVSPQSLHMQGRAIDIHLDEVSEESLRDYARSLNRGGVGFYGPLDFVHVDLGDVRYWEELGPRKLVGVLNPKAAVQLTSDKNDYLPQDELYFRWEYPSGFDTKAIRDIRLEHFWRGQWRSCTEKNQLQVAARLPSSSLKCGSERDAISGKFRWIFSVDGESQEQSSNEFYLKKS